MNTLMQSYNMLLLIAHYFVVNLSLVFVFFLQKSYISINYNKEVSNVSPKIKP